MKGELLRQPLCQRAARDEEVKARDRGEALLDAMAER